jgi:uncharacterized protein
MVTETKKASDNGAIAMAGLLVAIGIALAGYWMSDTLYKAKKLTNTVSVKGLAERELKANLAIWEMTYNVTGGDLKTVQEQAERSQQIIREFFRNLYRRPAGARPYGRPVQSKPHRSCQPFCVNRHHRRAHR